MKHDSDILKRVKSYFMRRKSAEEAYEFEREMERDPFLYEAIEGFEDMHVSALQQAMDELDDRLDRKARSKFSFAWWQAAVIVGVILVGAGVFAIVTNIGKLNTGREETVAREIKEEKQEQPEETGKSTEVATGQQYEPRRSVPWFDLLEDISDSINAVAASQPEEQPAAVPNGADALSPVKERTKSEEAGEKKSTALPAGEAIAAETTQDVMESTAMDQEIAATEEPASGESQMDALIKSEPETLHAMQESRAAQAPAAAETKSGPTAQPAGGMAAYRQYLSRNLQKSEGMPSGTVVVSFEFDKDGRPKKLAVQKSLCTACDAEAKRLVESGPAWEVGNRKERASVEVVFP